MIHNDIKIDDDVFYFPIDRDEMAISIQIMNETFEEIEDRLKRKYSSLSISIEFLPYKECTIEYLYEIKKYYMTLTQTIHYKKYTFEDRIREENALLLD